MFDGRLPDELRTHRLSDYLRKPLAQALTKMPKRIVEYQLGINVCPHLEGNKCRIYLNRPLACQSYPFEIEDVEPLRVYLEENCRWIKESIRTRSLQGLKERVLYSVREFFRQRNWKQATNSTNMLQNSVNLKIYGFSI